MVFRKFRIGGKRDLDSERVSERVREWETKREREPQTLSAVNEVSTLPDIFSASVFRCTPMIALTDVHQKKPEKKINASQTNRKLVSASNERRTVHSPNGTDEFLIDMKTK